MILLARGISPLQVIQESVDLRDAVLVHLGEMRFQTDSNPVEGLGPEHQAAQNQKRRSDRTREQYSANSGDDQHDTNLRGHVPDPAYLL
jgi:hypothetical protein